MFHCPFGSPYMQRWQLPAEMTEDRPRYYYSNLEGQYAVGLPDPVGSGPATHETGEEETTDTMLMKTQYDGWNDIPEP